MRTNKKAWIQWLPVLLSSASGVAIAAPAGGTVVSGNGSILPAGNTTTIQQNSANMVIDWQSFNIQSGEQVNFLQPGTTSIALNRDFSGIPSEIFGDLNANGQVFLLNTAGILIGSGANINVGGLFLSDMTLSDDEFENFTQSGSMTLQDTDIQAGGIQVEGAVTTSTRSGITLIGQFIDNSGSLTANDGNINLAVAGGPIVVTNNAGTLGVQISEGITQDVSPDQVLLNNSGDIRAINGNINIDIQYLSTLNLQAVRNTGLVNAVGVGYGRINQNIVLQTPDIDPVDGEEVEEEISDSLNMEDLPGSNENELAEEPTDNLSALDRLVDDCEPRDPDDTECAKKRAIKRYLGRLLIGGDLPDSNQAR